MMAHLDLGPWLWAAAWQSTVVLAAGLVISFFMRRHAARAHYVLLLCMLAGLLLPASNALVQMAGWGVLPPAAAIETSAYDSVPTEGGTTNLVSPEAGTSKLVLNKAELANMLLIAWVCVAGLMFVRMCFGFFMGLKLLARARPVVNEKLQALLETALGKIGLARTPVTFSTPDVRCPGIWCWAIHPALFLPDDMTHGDRKPADAGWIGIFCHELSHLKRRDHLPAIIAEIACCALWWQPLAWLCRNRMHRLADEACDGMVVSTGQPAADYADLLLSMVAQPRSLTALSMVSSKGNLRRRLDLILNPKFMQPALGAKWAVRMTIIAFCLTGCLTMLHPRPAQFSSLLANAGFESGDTYPSDWTQGAPVSGVEYVWDKKVAHTGHASLCLRKSENRYFPIAQWSQSVPAEAIGYVNQVKLSAWIRAEKAYKAILDVQFIDQNGNWRHQWAAYIGAKKQDDPPADHAWKKYEAVVNVPAGTQELTVGLQIYGPGTVWFDDIELSRPTSPTAASDSK